MRSRRGAFGALVVFTLVVGLAMMLDIVRADGVTPLEVAILGLFGVTFGWIAIAFWNAVIGFVLMLGRRDPLTLARHDSQEPTGRSISKRTALVMPVHNEDPGRVMRGLAAMWRSLDRTGAGDRFDLFLLSDTTDAAIARAEEAAWTALCGQVGGASRLHYRRRATNVGRKAGNIADFCERWGHAYDLMVVLDADSVMTGPAIVDLVRTMEDNPRAGLIQTVPLPARRATLFGRMVQFAAWLYSPMLAAGQCFWQTDAANYWGHNAVVRLQAFAAHCRLPVLPGRPPLGGPILSHDFVEAALLRRAGWEVLLRPQVEGSYEEVPANVVDYAKRDRRWCQGSLQHLRLLRTPGWHPMSRVHFVLGALGYVSSLLWLLLLLASSAYIVLPSAQGVPWMLRIPTPGQVVPLLAVTVVLLFMPKVLALSLAFVRRPEPFGGAVRLLVSALLEMLFAIWIAPLMMLYHTHAVLSVLTGHDIEWRAQARKGRHIPWPEAWRRTAGAVVVGVVWAGGMFYVSPTFALWLTPIFAGLLLAAPLVRWTSSRELGLWARQRGLFLVPSETEPPSELVGSPVATPSALPIPELPGQILGRREPTGADSAG